MILLRSLKLNNFLSYKSTEIVFKDDQKLLIDGKSGAGKSSIVEGIVWALYGQGRGDNRFMIRNGSTAAKVSLKLFDDEENKYYLIHRSLTAKKHELEILHSSTEDGPYIPILVSGIKPLQEFIEKNLLHSSYLLFLNSICYQQGNPEGFAQQTAAKRKDLLLEIARASDYDIYYEKSRAEIKSREASINEYTGANRGLKIRFDILNSSIKDLELLPEKEEKEKVLMSSCKELDNIMALQKNQNKLYTKLSELKGSEFTVILYIQEKEEQIKTYQNKLKELDSSDLITSQLEHEEYVKLSDELKILEENRNKYYQWSEKYNRILSAHPIEESVLAREESERDKAIKQVIEIQKNNDTKCIHCGNICTRCEDRIKSSLEFFNDQIKSKEYVIKNYKTQLEEKDTAIKEAGKAPEFSHESYQKVLGQLAGLRPKEQRYLENVGNGEDTNKLNSQIEEIKKDIEKSQAKQKDIQKEVQALSADFVDYTEQEIKLRKKIGELTSIVYSLDLKVTIAKQSQAEQEEINDEIMDNNKLIEIYKSEIVGLDLLKDAFGPNGIKVIVVDYMIPKLESKINDALSQLSDFRVRLDTQKSGAGKDVTLEGLFISIINEQGEQLDFNNYSGGERLKISVAISEALAELQKIGFRILDELFVGLDDESIEGFVNVLQILQSRFSQLLCVSHLKNIKDMFSEKLNIIKINGISQII